MDAPHDPTRGPPRLDRGDLGGDHANAPGGAHGHEPEYDAFVSYSTRADYHFVRALKGFLESFHRLKSQGNPLRLLRICVDGVNFSIASTQRLRAMKAPC